jgi:hypothetical protein
MFITLLAIILFIIIFTDVELVESWATSPGTLIQLAANSGPQDFYLTGYPTRGQYNEYVYDPVPRCGGRKDLYYKNYHPYRPSGWSFLDEFPYFW